MGPYSERRQLKRAEAVYNLLQQDNLSPWARQYWNTVLKRLSKSEAQYNHRVVETYTEMRNRYTKGWLK